MQVAIKRGAIWNALVRAIVLRLGFISRPWPGIAYANVLRAFRGIHYQERQYVEQCSFV